MFRRVALAILATSLMLVVGCSDDDSAPTIAPSVSAEAAPGEATATPVETIPARLGEPFDLHPWRITVKTVKCGTVAQLSVETNDGTQKPTDSVCVAAIRYDNIDNAPHQWADGSPEALTGYSAAGASYQGWTWMGPVTNPGLGEDGELIFNMAPGTQLAKIQIGHVLLTM